MGKSRSGHKENSPKRRNSLEPDELEPVSPKPPDKRLHAAMIDLAEVLSDLRPLAEGEERELDRLMGRLRERKHGRSAVVWAVYEHAKAGRLKVEIIVHPSPESPDGREDAYHVSPEPMLWDWWRRQSSEAEEGKKRKRRWTPANAEQFVRLLLVRAEKDGRTISLRAIAKETGIPKSTIAKTKAWKALGSDARRRITSNTEMTEDLASSGN